MANYEKHGIRVYKAVPRYILKNLRSFARLVLSFNPAVLSFSFSASKHRFSAGTNSCLLVSLMYKRIGQQEPVMKMEDEAAFAQRFKPLLEFATDIQDKLQHDQSWGEYPNHFSKIRDHTFVAPSSRHGLGLFANVDMEKDTIATFYPIHDLGGTQRVTFDKDYDGRYYPREYQQTLLHSCVERGITLGVDVRRADIPGWLAHRANDATICSGTSEAMISEYYETCERECNCIMLPFGNAVPLMALFTTRTVHKGEELLRCYDYLYWIKLPQGLEQSVESEVGRAEVAKRSVQGRESFFKLANRYQDCISLFETLLERKYKWLRSRPQSGNILQEHPQEEVEKAWATGKIGEYYRGISNDNVAGKAGYGNGAGDQELPFAWEETETDITLMLPVETVIDAKEVQCNFMKQSLRVEAASVRLEGTLRGPVSVADCYWVFGDSDNERRLLEIVLQKADRSTWAGVFEETPQISGLDDTGERP